MKKVLVLVLALGFLSTGFAALTQPVPDASFATRAFGCFTICDQACPQTCRDCCSVGGTFSCSDPYQIPCPGLPL